MYGDHAIDPNSYMDRSSLMRLQEGLFQKLYLDGKRPDWAPSDIITISYNPAIPGDKVVVMGRTIYVGNWYYWVFFCFRDRRDGFDMAVKECGKWAMKRIEEKIDSSIAKAQQERYKDTTRIQEIDYAGRLLVLMAQSIEV